MSGLIGLFGKNFKGGIKTFTSQMEMNKIPKVLQNKVVQHINAYGDAFFDEDSFKNFTVDSAREVLDTSHSRETIKTLAKGAENVVEPIKDKIGFNNITRLKNYFDMVVDSSSALGSEANKKVLGDFEKRLFDLEGRNGISIYNNLAKRPTKVYNALGITGKDVYVALADPDMAKNRILKNLGVAFRETDKEVTNSLERISLFTGRKGFVLSFNPDPLRVESLGYLGLTDALRKYTVLAENQIGGFAEKYLETARSGGKSLHTQFPSRLLKFRKGVEGLEDQYELLKVLTGLEDQDSLLELILKEKENNINRAYLYSKLGSKPEEAVQEVFRGYKLGLKAGELESIGQAEQRVIHKIKLAYGALPQDYGTMGLVADGVNNLMSGIYGASVGTIRNIFLDYPLHSLSLKKALLTDEGSPGFYFNRFFRPLSEMFQGALSSDRRAKLNDFLNSMDFGHTQRVYFGVLGLRGESYGDDFARTLKSPKKAEQYGESFRKGMTTFLHSMLKYSGSFLHTDATSAVNFMNTAMSFSNIVLKAGAEYGEFQTRLGPLAKNYMSALFGIGESEFKALSHVYKVHSKSLPAGEIKQSLGFQDLKVLLPGDIENLSGEVVRKYAKAFETPEQFKERLKNSYKSMLLHQRNLAQPHVYRSNRIVEAGLLKGQYIDMLLRFFSAFFNITHEQHRSLKVGLSIGIFGTPYDQSLVKQLGSGKGRMEWAKTLGLYSAGAVNVIWAKDLLSGRRPRALDTETFALLLASSGVGGIPLGLIGDILATRKKDSFYSISPLGSYLDTVQSLFSSNSAYSTVKAVGKVSGYPQLWYAKGAVDKLFREAFLDRGEKKRLENWYRDTLRSPFLGSEE